MLGTAAQPRNIGRGVFFVLAGMFFHFTWDDAAGPGHRGIAVFLVMLLSVVLSFTVLSIAFRRAAPREHQFVRDILAPEVQAGTLSDLEVEAVLDKHARKQFLKSAPNHHARQARKHLRRAILDLTHDVATAKGGASEDVLHARGEVDRLRTAAASSA